MIQKNTGYRELADAIVLQAVSDYRREARKLAKHPHDIVIARKKYSIASFFLSEWFGTLCALDGRKLLRGLNQRLEIMGVTK